MIFFFTSFLPNIQGPPLLSYHLSRSFASLTHINNARRFFHFSVHAFLLVYLFFLRSITASSLLITRVQTVSVCCLYPARHFTQYSNHVTLVLRSIFLSAVQTLRTAIHNTVTVSLHSGKTYLTVSSHLDRPHNIV